jgi:hypothetical protein
LNAQMMMARTNLAQGDRQYMKVISAPTTTLHEWKVELDARPLRRVAGGAEIRPRSE